jgi:hypothetical protein
MQQNTRQSMCLETGAGEGKFVAQEVWVYAVPRLRMKFDYFGPCRALRRADLSLILRWSLQIAHLHTHTHTQYTIQAHTHTHTHTHTQINIYKDRSRKVYVHVCVCVCVRGWQAYRGLCVYKARSIGWELYMCTCVFGR